MVESARREEEGFRGLDAHLIGFLKYLLVKSAPVATGVKPATLLRLSDSEERPELRGRSFFKQGRESILEALKVSCAVLRESETSTHVLLYSPKTLSETLAGEEAQELLKALGYERPHAADACLAELSRRFKSDSFPHEIGLFLGYPAEDVRGFVERRQDCHRIPGARWKIYGDPARSLFIMEAHRKAEATAMEAARKVDFT